MILEQHVLNAAERGLGFLYTYCIFTTKDGVVLRKVNCRFDYSIQELVSISSFDSFWHLAM